MMSLAAWDAAAGALLVTADGGRGCDFNGGNHHLRTHPLIADSATMVAAKLALLEICAKSSKTR